MKSPRLPAGFVLVTMILLASCGRQTSSSDSSRPVVQSATPARTLDSVRVETEGSEPARSKAENDATTSAPSVPRPKSIPHELHALDGRTAAPADYLPHGHPLPLEEAHRLLSGKVIFNPKPITSSNTAVAPDTPLFHGQDLQVKYGEQWWAGSVLGFEKDGRVRVHYFGWADSWDEPKPRAELQLDSGARVRALDSTYTRDGW